MAALLNATGLTRTFGELRAVDSVDLTVSGGDRHAIIGPNGAGKTTLLNMLAGTIPVSAGRVAFVGRNITRRGPAHRARLGIGRTFQKPATLGSQTAIDNVVAAVWPHRRHRLQWLGFGRKHLVAHGMAQLDQLGIAKCAGIPAAALSHGQRRLLEIAAVLATEPKLLLLDEPAAGLTDADLVRLVDCLGGLPSELAVLIVEHNQDVVTSLAKSVTVLHQGQILTSGTPAEIAVDPEVARVYLGVEAMD